MPYASRASLYVGRRRRANATVTVDLRPFHPERRPSWIANPPRARQRVEAGWRRWCVYSYRQWAHQRRRATVRAMC